MSEITAPWLTTFGVVFDACPEPHAAVDADAIVACNRAFRACFGEVTSLRACLDGADHDKLASGVRNGGKFVARPSTGPNAGTRMQWTAWSIDERVVCLRLDGRAGPEIPAALKSYLAEPARLSNLLAGKMFEQLDAISWAIAADGTILISDGAGLQHFGVKSGSTAGLNAFKIYPPDSTACMEIRRALAGESVRAIQIESNEHWLRALDPIRDAQGDITAMVGFALCASVHSSEVQQSRALLRAIAELPVTIWAMDADGTCTLSIGKGLRHFGLESGQLVGKNLLKVYPETSETHAHIQRALLGESIAQEIRVGDMTWFSTLLPIRDPLGKNITQVYGVAENITERSLAQQRIEEQLELIKSQQEAITALTSPIIEVWQGVLVVPLIGSLDGDRAGRLLEHLLQEVVQRQSRAVILDLTGTHVVDPATAQHLFDIMRSVRLLGAEGLVSGIRPNVAKTMVELDIASTQWQTFPTLAEALRRLIGKNLKAR